MNIDKIKKKLLKWEDFYGQDIADTEAIEQATTKKELKAVLQGHIEFLEDQNTDAIRNAEDFMRSLKLED